MKPFAVLLAAFFVSGCGVYPTQLKVTFLNLTDSDLATTVTANADVPNSSGDESPWLMAESLTVEADELEELQEVEFPGEQEIRIRLDVEVRQLGEDYLFEVDDATHVVGPDITDDLELVLGFEFSDIEGEYQLGYGIED